MRTFLIAITLSLSLGTSAQTTDNRAEYFDILHTNIYLDIPDIGVNQVYGICTHEILVKDNSLGYLSFDLLALQVDSVLIDGQVSFTHNDTLLKTYLPASAGNGDTITVKIHYQGSPVKDASGWGGFYVSGGYIFNLGVGFAADPHNYGRIWYPCVDNFIEKSTYSFEIRIDSGYSAYCNGLLTQVADHPDGTRSWFWEIGQAIPSYLVCMAVSDYTHAEWEYQGEQSTFPVYLIARAGDTSKMKSSFIHLDQAIEAFEKYYGPQVFDKVGFVAVPFNGGAMEHATSIAYPKYALNGNTNFETLMAHELAHHWWGDQVTCTSAEDMWINEGWASYSEALFLQAVYGEQRYRDYVAANHKKVLQFAHVRDDGYRAISGVPHAYTYGTHVYDKGADVVHTLRSYLGDSLFTICCRAFMAEHSMLNASSYDLMDYLSSCSGIDMADFFNGWVFEPGFPHFSIDSFSFFNKDDKFNTTVFIRQRLNHAPAFYDQVPLEITFFGKEWQKQVVRTKMSGQCGRWHVSLDFEPVVAILDMDEKISDAISSDQLVLNAPGSHTLSHALMDLAVVSFDTDSVFVRVEHNWVPPDAMKHPMPGLHLSDYRYWKIDGLFPDSWVANAVVKFDGTTSNTNGYLDNTFITNVEDSIVAMYRPSPAHDWSIVQGFEVKTIGSNTNKFGQVVIPGIKKGEYALAIYDHNRTDTIARPIPSDCQKLNNDFKSETVPPGMFKVFPNPGNHSFTIQLGPTENEREVVAYTIGGKKMLSMHLEADEVTALVETSDWTTGTYLVKAFSDEAVIGVGKVVILR